MLCTDYPAEILTGMLKLLDKKEEENVEFDEFLNAIKTIMLYDNYFEEMEVLFTFLAERYERRSVVITSNLVFSQWDQIFKDPLTTAAAIDRVVHHSVIIEFGPDIPSMRAEQAALRNPTKAKAQA